MSHPTVIVLFVLSKVAMGSILPKTFSEVHVEAKFCEKSVKKALKITFLPEIMLLNSNKAPVLVAYSDELSCELKK
jgi:hypothetical protein